MKNVFAITFTTFLLAFTSPAGADVTLNYELTEPDGHTTTKTFSTARFYVRVDDSTEDKRHLLFEAGRFFSLYRVDESKSTFERLTPKVIPHMGAGTPAKEKSDAYRARFPADEPRAPVPVLKPTSKKNTVAGIPCRIVNEMLDNRPVVEHCMANSANLEVTSREIITMTRLFKMARDRAFDWLGVGTQDEEFISVQSRDLQTSRALKLISVSTSPLTEGYLRIPKNYKNVTPDPKTK